VAVRAIEHRMTMRGMRHKLLRREIVLSDYGTAHEEDAIRTENDGLIAALETILSSYPQGRMTASIILSNHIARYVLVPWNESLFDDNERMAYALHCFRQVYGEVANDWELRLSPDRDGAAQVSSAVDRRLLASLRESLARRGVTIKSICPHLMAAYNGVNLMLRQSNAWFAVVEPGNLCLALLRNGRLVRLRSMRITNEWQAEMHLLLEREECLAGVNSDVTEVFVITSDDRTMPFPTTCRWKFRRISPLPVQGDVATDEWYFTAPDV
jgi:hypothetical protein